MARVTKDGYSGRIGNEVHYIRNGQHFVRKRPRKRSKRRPKLETVKVFSHISRMGTPMVTLLLMLIRYLPRLRTYNTIRGWMRREYTANDKETGWPLEARRLSTCQLNPDCDLRNILAADMGLSCDSAGTVTLQLPGLAIGRDLVIPAWAARVKIKCVVISAAFDGYINSPGYATAETEYDCHAGTLPATHLELETKAPAKHLLLVTLALEFSTMQSGGNSYSDDMKWKPVAVVGIGRV